VTAEATPAALLPVVPTPERITLRTGSFPLTPRTPLALSDPADPELRALGVRAARFLGAALGGDLEIAATAATHETSGAVVLLLAGAGMNLGAEGYHLAVGPARIRIVAATHAGLFYGLQTLEQLVFAHRPDLPAPLGSIAVAALEIEDRPRFSYRGMHLDVGRHYFPVSFIKRYIDLLAAYKFNTFHWHLTEDQGWRIEILEYPGLTDVGSCRAETILEKNFDPYVGDGERYCGYYTQDEIRDVVEYARARHVTVIPEIEMPGHSVAALAAYPELGCTEGPFEVATRWGVTEDIYCPSEETFSFLEDVLTEVMELFPGRYIHIGGDEAPKSRWEQSELAQEVIRREGLADEHELQSYFIRRIERFLLEHGRRLIGWDEILEGGLAPEATVMSWRGMDGGIEAARQGHDVIMTPTSHVYFDYYQGDPRFEPLAIGGLTTLERVYGFEPVPEELNATEARHVLGAQANLWTEYIKTPEYAEYMALPRMLALAEVVWSPKDARDWESFAGRLPGQLHRLDAMGVNYRIPHVRGLERDRLTLDDAFVVLLRTLVPGAEIRYTTDGTDPDDESSLYTGPLSLPVDEGGVTVTARAFLPTGRASAPSAATLNRTSLRPAVGLDAGGLAPGLRYAYYEADVASVDSLETSLPVGEGVVDVVRLMGTERDEQFGYVFTGYLRVPSDAVYAFTLLSDDGSKLFIGDDVVIDHDGPHGPTERYGMIALEAGYHPISVRFFQAGGGKALGLIVQVDGDGVSAPLADWLFHEN